MEKEILLDLFENFKKLKFAIVGDFALDFYYQINQETEEKSLETGNTVFHGSHPKISLGGAGNLAKNLRNLGLTVDCYGLKGNDLFGREIDYQLEKLSIGNFIKSNPLIDTTVYTKPLEKSLEKNRIDFGTKNIPLKEFKKSILEELVNRQNHYDFILLNEQINEPFLGIEEIIFLEKNLNPKIVLGDFRKNGKWVNSFPLKINLKEFNQLKDSQLTESEIKKIQINLEHFIEGRDKYLILTLGENGLIFKDAETSFHQAGLKSHNTIDTVGAGDMILAGFSAAYAASKNPKIACELANMAAFISIHQINSTGEVFPKEILSLNEVLNL